MTTKKDWKCPKCGECRYPPKGYTCPTCNVHLTTEYEIDRDFTFDDVSSGNMNVEEFEGRK